MIKRIAYCLFIIMLTSCKQSGENKAQSKVSELPLGVIELTQYNFPFAWKNLKNIDDQNPSFNIRNISKKGYDSIFYFIHKNSTQYYDSLVTKREQKLPFIPKINDTINNNQSYKIDSAYFIKSFNTGNITVKLYKDGNKYATLAGDENIKIVNYLLLASFDKNEKLIDTSIIFYNVHGLYDYNSRYFFIDKYLNIITKDFYVDETDTYYKGGHKTLINKEGKFITSKNINSQSKNNIVFETIEVIKSKYIKPPFKINQELVLDFDNDNKRDILIALEPIDNNIDCGKEKGKQPLLILQNKEPGKYHVYYFGDNILPSICSYGDADAYLDFSYEKGLIHFKSISKIDNNIIMNRDYYFNSQLNLNHITFSKSIIGQDKTIQKTFTSKDFGNISIKDFQFENFKESKFGL